MFKTMFSETQTRGPNDSQKRIHRRPRQAHGPNNRRLPMMQPLRHSLEDAAQIGNAGCDESWLRHQRRRVEGAGMRLGSLSGGAVSSPEHFCTKRRRIASLRALYWE